MKIIVTRAISTVRKCWLVYAHDENSGMGADAIPEVLFAVMSWSQKQGCDHVLFDRDGNIVDELARFDW
jgi:hypothetical protein